MIKKSQKKYPMQTEINFTTASPVNIEKMKGQNKRLYDYLSSGNTIHCFHPARRELKIGYLNSRCSDLANKNHVQIYKRYITVKDSEGIDTTVKEYSMFPFKDVA